MNVLSQTILLHLAKVASGVPDGPYSLLFGASILFGTREQNGKMFGDRPEQYNPLAAREMFDANKIEMECAVCTRNRAYKKNANTKIHFKFISEAHEIIPFLNHIARANRIHNG